MAKLLEQVRAAVRIRHYSYRTEKTYVHWIKQYILFSNKRHPAELGPQDVSSFLSHLAVDRNVAASTQNQALAAILFLSTVTLQQHLLRVQALHRRDLREGLDPRLGRVATALPGCLDHSGQRGSCLSART